MEALILVFSFLPFLTQPIFRKFIYFEILALVAVFLHGIYLFGPEILILLAVTYIVSTIAELVSLKTPIYCFGVRYSYNLNHKMFASKINLLGVYPIEVTFAWIIFKYMAFCVGMLISRALALPLYTEIMMIPFILLSIDFIVDPVAVNVNKVWKWDSGSRYFGIPWQNFLGWYLVGLVSTLIFSYSGLSRTIDFNYLFLIPLVFYSNFLKDFPVMYKMNRKLAIIGTLPLLSLFLLGVMAFIKLL